jgi:hypothetical protein
MRQSRTIEMDFEITPAPKPLGRRKKVKAEKPKTNEKH